MRKKVDTLEATIVRKLIARTPPGPTGVGALKVLKDKFQYYDAEGDGSVDLPSFTRVLAALNVVSALPPSDAEREVIAALFERHARKSDNEVVYDTFAFQLLRSSGTLVPAAEAQAAVDRAQWQYSTAVAQAVSRRNLQRSEQTPLLQPNFREPWVEASAAARAVEEGALAHVQVTKLSEAYGAETRGRFAGTAEGMKELQKFNANRRQALDLARSENLIDTRQVTREYLQREAMKEQQTLANWMRIQQQNQELRGMTPGAAAAAARRTREI